MPIREVLAVHTSEELTEWQVYLRRIRPLPDSYWQAGLIAAAVYNAAAAKGKRFVPEDFMPVPPPGYERPGRAQSSEAMLNVMKRLADRQKAVEAARSPQERT